jgi:uncharacterized protein
MAETELLLRMAIEADEAADFERALALFTQGARLGDALCWHALGYMHALGTGVSVDTDLALKYYRRAWRLGAPSSANNIAIIYSQKGNWRMMFRWFARAAELGDEDAFLHLARCFRDGTGVRRSTPDMLRCARKALENEYATEEDLQEAREMLSQHRLRSVDAPKSCD